MNSLRNKLSNRKLMQNGFAQIQSYSTTTSSSNIQIPNRKERSPTDILMALESTIKRDPTAPHYKFIDDPCLIPASTLDKRSYTMSREAGRKAAMWIRQEHAEFFDHKVAEPFIESYAPRADYSEKSKVSEEILLNNIKSGYVTNSIEIYNLLDRNVTVETKLALFELLCFYNSANPINEELIEERWFSYSNFDSTEVAWKECPIKSDLYQFLIKENSDIATAAYNTMLCGLLKHRSLIRAWDLYEECKTQDIPLMKRTYDSLINAVSVAHQKTYHRLLLMEEILRTMVQKNLQLDVNTLNACLQLLAKLKMLGKKKFASKLLSEFNEINVKPNLASFYYLLRSFSNDSTLMENTLTEIMDILEKEKVLKAYSLEDKLFFCQAMKSAYLCNSASLGKRIHNLLLKDNNYLLLLDNYQESVYYRHYLLLQLNVLSFKSYMELYEEIVPNIYTPEQQVFQEMLYALKDLPSSDATDALQMLCSHAIMLDFMRSDIIIDILLDLMCNYHKPSPDSPINKVFANSAWTIWNESKEIKMKSKRGFNFESAILEKISILCIRADEFEQMLQVLSYLLNNKQNVNGILSAESMKEIFDACLARGHNEAILNLIEYAIEYDYDDGKTMGLKAYKTLPLSVAQANKLEFLVGQDLQKLQINNNES